MQLLPFVKAWHLAIYCVVLVHLFWVEHEQLALLILVGGALFVYWEFCYVRVVMWTYYHIDQEFVAGELADFFVLLMYVFLVEKFARVWL